MKDRKYFRLRAMSAKENWLKPIIVSEGLLTIAEKALKDYRPAHLSIVKEPCTALGEAL